MQKAPWTIRGYMDCWFRPLNPKGKIILTLRGQYNRYGMPTTMRIWDAEGKPVSETCDSAAIGHPTPPFWIDCNRQRFP